MDCQICHNSYNLQNKKPVQLPCQHTFCFKCIYQLKKSAQEQIQCPIDQQLFDKFTQFPFNQQMLEQLRPESQKQIQQENIRLETLEIIDKQMSRITDSFDHNFKIVTLGSAFTGKTCLLSRYFKNIFQNTTPTLTIDFFTKSLIVDGKNIMVTAYDTAGSESYKSMTQKYVRDKHCLFYVFDISNKQSFREVDEWLRWSEEFKREDSVMILVGTKKDKENEREVSTVEALEFSRERGMAYFEVSALNEENVKEVFEFAIQKCYQLFKFETDQEKTHFKIVVAEKKNKGCFDWLMKLFN